MAVLKFNFGKNIRMDGITETVVTPTVVVEPSAPAAPDVSVSEPAAAPIESSPDPVDAPSVAETPVEAENILGDTETPEPEAKPEVREGEDKPADAPAEIKPAEVVAPVYEEFKLPENYSVAPESLAEFTKLLGELETASGKLDHKGYQDAGQKLIDLGTKNVQDSIERLNKYYSEFHENQKKEWFESFKKDPDMGGEKLQTTVGALRSAVEQYGGNAEQIAEFRQVMKDTGVGNHPAVTRLLFNMQQKINKYETESDGNRIVPGAKPAPNKVKSYQQFYGSN